MLEFLFRYEPTSKFSKEKYSLDNQNKKGGSYEKNGSLYCHWIILKQYKKISKIRKYGLQVFLIIKKFRYMRNLSIKIGRAFSKNYPVLLLSCLRLYKNI